MVFERQDDAAFVALGQTFLDAIDAPLEAVVFGVTGQDRLFTAGLHEFVEGLNRVPAARVEANAGNAQLVGNLNALLRVFDLLLTKLGARVDEVLVNREGNQAHAAGEGVAFELAQVGAMVRRQRILFGNVHLAVKDVHALDAQHGGLVDDGLNGDLHRLEVPVGVRGNAKLDAFARRVGRGLRTVVCRACRTAHTDLADFTGDTRPRPSVPSPAGAPDQLIDEAVGIIVDQIVRTDDRGEIAIGRDIEFSAGRGQASIP